ncbi:YoaK family protein [Nocardioides sp. L-11A]|uniref:YoaK family protein n=1 Tax=Nocardioides sp. L-11A TaxID=3043848 RepID=UPI00249A2D76|nr:YoaK family protein [Nocardioides sp. L-11A]
MPSVARTTPPTLDATRARYLAVLLCLTSGSLDAISFLALGEVFASVMTGNVVFSGIALVSGDGAVLLACALALCSYVAGVVVGSRLAASPGAEVEGQHWPPGVTRALRCQLGLMLLLCLGWVLADPAAHDEARLALLAGSAGAMGIQGAAVRRLGVTVSTTYMTGALTTVIESVALGKGLPPGERAAALGLVLLCVGAAIGALAVTEASWPSYLVPATFLALTLLMHGLVARRSGRSEARSSVR